MLLYEYEEISRGTANQNMPEEHPPHSTPPAEHTAAVSQSTTNWEATEARECEFNNEKHLIYINNNVAIISHGITWRG